MSHDSPVVGPCPASLPMSTRRWSHATEAVVAPPPYCKYTWSDAHCTISPSLQYQDCTNYLIFIALLFCKRMDMGDMDRAGESFLSRREQGRQLHPIWGPHTPSQQLRIEISTKLTQVIIIKTNCKSPHKKATLSFQINQCVNEEKW